MNRNFTFGIPHPASRILHPASCILDPASRILYLASCILFLASFSLHPASGCFAQTDNGKKTEVIILHLNDMHAKTDGFAKIKYLADSLKRVNPNVFILSAGDNFTGNPFIDMVSDKGSPMIDLMNRSGFTLSCFGNHEFDLGQVFLEKRIEQAGFPFICANINTGNSVLKQPEAWYILKAGNLQIPVLGLIEINDKGIPDTHPSKVEGIRFTDPFETAGKFTALKKKYGSLIALTHLGVEADKKLARDYPEIDVIIGGHSHTILKLSLTEAGVSIVQAGSYQRFIGKLTLVYSGNSIVEKRDTLIVLESLKGSDETVQNLVKSYENNPEFEKVAGIAETAIKGKQNLGALMTDAVAWTVKADFAFQNKGGIRIQSIPEGEIRIKDIYRLDPFGNQVVVYKLSGKEIEDLVLRSFKKERDIDLYPSGMTYVIKKAENEKKAGVKMQDLSGKPLQPEKTYTVALNSYIAAAYDFTHSDPGKTLELTTEECLIRFLEYRKKVNYSDDVRVKSEVRKKKK